MTRVVPMEAYKTQFSRTLPQPKGSKCKPDTQIVTVGLECHDAIVATQSAPCGKDYVSHRSILASLDTFCDASVLIVNIDAYEDLMCAVDSLIAFRIRCPTVGVIIVSALFGGDEFLGERKPIADISLRAPLSQRRFKRALIDAVSGDKVGAIQ